MMKGSFSASGLWTQLLMLLFLALGGAVLFTSVGLLLGMLIFDMPLKQVQDFLQAGNTAVIQFMQGFSTLGTFLAPALFAAYLFADEPDQLLKVQRWPRRPWLIFGLVILLTFSSTTLSDALYRISRNFIWPDGLEWLKEIVEAAEVSMMGQMEDILVMDSMGAFLSVWLVMAVLPAVCEESFFRGVLQPLIKRGTGRRHLAVWLSAFAFAMLHLQFYTFLSIFILGAAMGYLREWTNSLWPSIVMHLINNSSIVVAIYFFDMRYEEINDLSSGWNYWYAIPGMAVFMGALFALYQLRQRE